MKIQIISPSFRKDWRDRIQSKYGAYASPGTEIRIAFLEHGPESIESDYDVALAAPDVIALARKAEADGMQAVLIDCMADPGLFAARESVNIPVIGPAQASMSLAATLADRFSVVTILERDRPLIHNQWRLYDLMGRGASVRSVNIPVLALDDDEEQLIEAMIKGAIRAVAEDGAHAIVFGCTGMGGLAGPVQQGLAEAGYNGVPVIDPTGVALKLAENLVSLGLRHSKLTFPSPPGKRVKGYDRLAL